MTKDLLISEMEEYQYIAILKMLKKNKRYR